MQRTHEAGRVGLVGSDLSVDLDESLLNDRGDLSSGKGVLQSVSEEDGEGERLSQLVRTGRRSGSLGVRLYTLVRDSVNSRRCRPVCRASMTREQRDA